MKTHRNRQLAAALLLGGSLLLPACEKSEAGAPDNSPVTWDRAYVIPATVDGTTYLVTAPSLDEGSVSTRGNGTEVLDATYWIYRDGRHLFSLAYNKGGAGTGASYYLDAAGRPVKRLSYECNRITTYGSWGDRIITVSTGNSRTTDDAGNIAQALLFNYLDTRDGQQTSGSTLAENLLGNGERVTFAGLVEIDGQLFTSVIPTGMSRYGIARWPEAVTDPELIAASAGGTSSSAYEAGEIPSTQYPDRAWVAIYPDGNLQGQPTLLSTDRIGFACGRMRSQYYQTIWAADNGDLYLFSPGYGRTFASSADLKRVSGTLPSGVVRIRRGAAEFDPDYYVNLEETGTRKPLYRCWHIAGDRFLLQLYRDGLEGMKQGSSAVTDELAIFLGEERRIIPVTGLPADLTGFGGEPCCTADAAYIAVSVRSGGNPAFYRIDAQTGVATKGLTVEADAVTTAGILSVQR